VRERYAEHPERNTLCGSDNDVQRLEELFRITGAEDEADTQYGDYIYQVD
jgi:hypothetical protein